MATTLKGMGMLNYPALCAILSPRFRCEGDGIMKTVVTKHENGYVLSIAFELLQQLGITEDEPLHVFKENDRLIIQKEFPVKVVSGNPYAERNKAILAGFTGAKTQRRAIDSEERRARRAAFRQQVAEYEGDYVAEEWDTGSPVGNEVF